MRHIEDTTQIYSVYFMGDKIARKGYIGISKHPDVRRKQHLANREKQKFFKGCDNMEFYVLHSGLGYTAAAEKETSLICEYISKGWKMFNKRLTASMPIFVGDPTSEDDVRFNLQCHGNNLINAIKAKMFYSVPEKISESIIKERIDELAEGWNNSPEYATALYAYFGETDIMAMSNAELSKAMDKFYQSCEFENACRKYLNQ